LPDIADIPITDMIISATLPIYEFPWDDRPINRCTPSEV